MHPAISVIFFTVLSGAGFGMLAIIGLDIPLGYSTRDDPVSVFLISALAVGLAVAGLISSTFHLGRPGRAWRAFSQWRSSWLSREGIAAVGTLVLYGIYALIWMIEGERLVWLGIIVGLGGILTVFTTAMIYTQMKTVPHWNTWVTPVTYLLFSLCTGYLLVAGISDSAVEGDKLTVMAGTLVLLFSWAAKILWWQRARKNGFGDDDTTNSTIATATGLGKIGKVRLLERPHTGPNYLTREMVHVIGRKHAARLKLIALVVGGLLPLLILLMVYLDALPQGAMMFAALLMIAGLFAERWLFFAEAEHSVSLYY
jgi:DMSO reductase anchor subunit